MRYEISARLLFHAACKWAYNFVDFEMNEKRFQTDFGLYIIDCYAIKDT